MYTYNTGPPFAAAPDACWKFSFRAAAIAPRTAYTDPWETRRRAFWGTARGTGTQLTEAPPPVYWNYGHRRGATGNQGPVLQPPPQQQHQLPLLHQAFPALLRGGRLDSLADAAAALPLSQSRPIMAAAAGGGPSPIFATAS
jgi:hypothetical protein